MIDKKNVSPFVTLVAKKKVAKKVTKKKVVKKVAKKVTKKKVVRKAKPMNFNAGVKVTPRDTALFSKHMTNWQLCRKFMAETKLTENLIRKMIAFECERDAPRETILKNLVQRFNSVRRAGIELELERFLKQPMVARTATRQK